MPQETSQKSEIDLEKTDRLPALEMAAFDQEFGDDAVPLEYPAGGPVAFSRGLLQSADFARPSSLDLPSLAETVRSVEERIARQNAEHEALQRDYEKALEGESSAVIRANGLAAELGSIQTALEAQQAHARDVEKSLEEKIASVEAARQSAEGAMREAERLQGETHALRESLASRDSQITQILHSLGERDAQFLALQTEHARIIPELEERYRTGSRLESDLETARAKVAALDQELDGSKSVVVSLSDQIKRREAELAGARAEAESLRVRSASYLETLRTQDWRQGYHLNAIRELEGELAAAQSTAGTLVAERDALKRHVDQLTGELDARRQTIGDLQDKVEAHVASLVAKDDELQARDEAHAAALAAKDDELQARGEAHELALAAKDDELQARDEAHAAALAAKDVELQSRDATHAAALEAKDEELRVRDRSHAVALMAKDDELQARDQAHADLSLELVALKAEQGRLTALVAARDAAIEATRAAGADEAQRLNGLLDSAALKSEEQSAEIARLQAESANLRRDMETLTSSLSEARRPIDTIQAEVQRLSAELAVVTARGTELEGENAKLRSSLERTRGALEEREFLIRRLERSESNNANVLGRIQTSIERLGVSPSAAGRGDAARADPGRSDSVRADVARADLSRSDILRADTARASDTARADSVRLEGARADLPKGDILRADISRADLPRTDIPRTDIPRADIEWAVEMVRIDGGKSIPHPLGKRTRVGRATGCELRIDSSSVSRHHALILVGPRDILIEDLNSTNGVYINGRKASRQVLSDGDTLTIGEALFRFSAKSVPRRESPAAP